jgi:hypothetical protein
MQREPAVIRGRSVQQIAGLAGLIGGLVLAVAGLADPAGSLVPLGFGLIWICEIGLLKEFARARPRAAALGSLILIPGAIVGIMGIWSFVTTGSLIGISLLAVGFGLWFVAVPILAIGCAGAGLVDAMPANSLALLSALAVLASATGDAGLERAVWTGWSVAWTWLGYALIRPVPVDSRVADGSGGGIR